MAIDILKCFDNLGEQPANARRSVVTQFNKLVTYLFNSTSDNPGFAINSNFDIKNGNAITYCVGGVLHSLAATQNFNTGTTANIAADKWGIAILTHDGTTATVTWAQASTAMAYASEALAIAALGTGNLIPASGFASLGYVTVKTASGDTWTAGTDALEGGTGGNASSDTNYYNDPTLNGTFAPSQIGDLTGVAITA